MQVANTLPDVNPDEVLGSLDADTRDYLRILLNAGGTAFRDTKPADTGQTPGRTCGRPSSASSPPPATAASSPAAWPSGAGTSAT